MPQKILLDFPRNVAERCAAILKRLAGVMRKHPEARRAYEEVLALYRYSASVQKTSSGNLAVVESPREKHEDPEAVTGTFADLPTMGSAKKEISPDEEVLKEAMAIVDFLLTDNADSATSLRELKARLIKLQD